MPVSAAGIPERRSMLVFPSGHSRSVLVARLRAAGCVFAEDEAELLISAARSPGHLNAMVDRRTAGQPLEHVVGWADFCGLRIAVEPGVFVPRRRTGFLARQAVDLTRRRSTGAVVVELCCGSGAVAAVVVAALPRIEVYAVDIDAQAVRCARRNLAAAQSRVYQGDLYQPLPRDLRGRVDILVANAPYVPTGAVGLLPPEARLHEPREALDGGPDGLDVLRRVIAEASQWLTTGGHLLVEASAKQAPELAETIAHSGLTPHVLRCDDWDATVVVGATPV